MTQGRASCEQRDPLCRHRGDLDRRACPPLAPALHLPERWDWTTPASPATSAAPVRPTTANGLVASTPKAAPATPALCPPRPTSTPLNLTQSPRSITKRKTFVASGNRESMAQLYEADAPVTAGNGSAGKRLARSYGPVRSYGWSAEEVTQHEQIQRISGSPAPARDAAPVPEARQTPRPRTLPELRSVRRPRRAAARAPRTGTTSAAPTTATRWKRPNAGPAWSAAVAGCSGCSSR